MVMSANRRYKRAQKYARKGRALGRRAGRRSGRGAVSGRTKSQTARITETIEIIDLNPNTSYANAFSLSQFARASSIAPFFRWYKATKVTYQYEPLYNTFQEGGGPSVSAPYFYSLMNRTQDSHVTTLNDIQACGAKPIKLTRMLTKSYRPNWCSPGLITYGTAVATQGVSPAMVGLYNNGLKAEYGWLQSPNSVDVNGTGVQIAPFPSADQAVPGGSNPAVPIMAINNTNQVMYNGHDVFIDQQNAPQATVVCRLTCTVEWAFKDPNNATNLSSEGPTNILAGKYSK